MNEILKNREAIGRCGAGLGSKFWDLLAEQHSIDGRGVYRGDCAIQTNYLDVYFDSARCGRYIPRSVVIDFEKEGFHDFRTGKNRRLYRPDNFVYGDEGTGNNWAKGYYTCGMKIIKNVMDIVRKETERCDSMDGIQFFHSLGGGCGGGLSSLMLPILRDMFPDKMICANAVVPSPVLSELIIEPYNAVFSVVNLAFFTDLVFCFDNEALTNICTSGLNIELSKMVHLNKLAATVIANISTSFRFPGMLNCDLAKFARAMVPLPRAQFLIESLDPPYGEKFTCHEPCVRQIIRHLLSDRNLMAACNTRLGKYIASGCVIPNKVSLYMFEKEASKILYRSSNLFNKEVAPNLQVLACTLPPKYTPVSVSFVGNNTAITQLWKRLIGGFDSLLHKRAYVHLYQNEGMYVDEFESKLEQISSITNAIEEMGGKVADDFNEFHPTPEDLVSDLESVGSDFSAFK